MPLGFSFTQNTNLQPTTFLSDCKETRSQMWLWRRASYYCFIAVAQFGFFRACETLQGSMLVRNSERCILGLLIPALIRVCIGWLLGGLGKDSDSLGITDSNSVGISVGISVLAIWLVWEGAKKDSVGGERLWLRFKY